MSTSLTHLVLSNPGAATASARLLTPSTLPVPLLPSAWARKYSYAHTAVVGIYYYARAPAMVADPVATMAIDLVAVALLQAFFCAACLPSTGSWLSNVDAGRPVDGTPIKSHKPHKASIAIGTGLARRRQTPLGSKGGGRAAAGDGLGGSLKERILPTLYSTILAVCLPPLPLSLIALVLGAPLYPTSTLLHTLLLSTHVSILGFLPLFYTHGVSSSAWRDVAAAWLPFDEAGVWAGTVGCLVGGWVGAVPIALDWDREWQKWPCTVLWGVVAGWILGRVLTNGARWGIGTRINMSEHEEPDDELAPVATPVSQTTTASSAVKED